MPLTDSPEVPRISLIIPKEFSSRLIHETDLKTKMASGFLL